MRWLSPFLLIFGCAKAPLGAPPRSVSTWKVATAEAAGDRTLTSLYTVQVDHEAPQVWAFRTTHSQGTVEERGQDPLIFDSAYPKGSDPWPLTAQHAVSTVVTLLRMSPEGAPAELVDEAAWRANASEAIAATGLPPAAIRATERLVDPGGVVADARRSFTGIPPTEGPWQRTERVAGLESTRIETCTVTRSSDEQVWTCEGDVIGPEVGRNRLFQTTSRTVVTVDRKGLKQVDIAYEGTLVFHKRNGEYDGDMPIVGRRKVARTAP